MKIIKTPFIFLITLFIFCAFVPEANARHHRCKSRMSLGFRFNCASAPKYIVAPPPVYTYPYHYAPVQVNYYAPAPIMIERPAPCIYMQPGFSYSYWRY